MYTPDGRGLRAYKQAIALAAASRARRAGWEISKGPHELEVVALFKRPPSHLAKGGSIRSTAPLFPGHGCGDLDNIVKAAQDAVTKGCGIWADDTQVVSYGGSMKAYAGPGEPSRLVVTIRRPA
jgi:Holliday junction resolvase RusA-like endonuclease